MIAIPIGLTVYERGSGGVPSSVLVPHSLLPSAYQHAISDQYGYESMSFSASVPLDVGLDWLSNGLMREVIVSGPDAGTIWQGFINKVELRAGQESRSLSMDAMYNRLRCKYTVTSGGPDTTSTTSDSTSIAMYGTKDLVVSLGNTTATGAANKAARALSLYKQPRATGSSQIASGRVGDVELTINCAGWYATLDWVLTSRSSTTVTSTTTQVGALLATSGIGIGATNAFLSASTNFIVSSGVSDTEYIESDTPFRDKIEALLQQGNSVGAALAWGIYDARTMVVEVAADASPATIQYQRSAGEGVLRDVYGSRVNLWDARPNKMYIVRELLSANPTVVAPDAGESSYIARVQCSIGENGVSLGLEGRSGESIDQIVARVR